ncbi:hypothetical protein [Kitasatospora sp. NPDC057500]|uniref:hypothetical protein n=1 Tax=Kitasatospora sp. NPDC057500 TaxID=3346151 RepID=UPI0036C6DD3B
MNLMTRLAAALALTLAASGAQAANVLVVLSDENHLDLKDGKVAPRPGPSWCNGRPDIPAPATTREPHERRRWMRLR